VKLVPEPEPCGDAASAAAMQDESSVSESVCSELKWNVKFYKDHSVFREGVPWLCLRRRRYAWIKRAS